jgi:hypothetical protein
MTVSIFSPFPRFDDVDGQPLDGGFIYVGTANMDPVSNPVAVFFDAAMTVSASQPLRTSGGFIVDGSGTPQNIYTAADFSIVVCNRLNVPRYSLASYGFRIFSDAITFNSLIVGTSIVPDAAGGAFDGTIALPWSNQVTRNLQAKTATVYDTAQPVVAADLAKLNQRRLPVMIGGQSSIGAPSSVNIYNVASIVRTAAVPAGSYDIVPTVALPASVCVQVTGILSSGTAQLYQVVARSTTLIRVETYLAGVLTDLAFDFVVFGNPAVTDPIL